MNLRPQLQASTILTMHRPFRNAVVTPPPQSQYKLVLSLLCIGLVVLQATAAANAARLQSKESDNLHVWLDQRSQGRRALAEGRISQAETCFLAALQKARANLEWKILLATSLLDLGELYMHQGPDSYSKASQMLRQEVAVLTSIDGLHPELAHPLYLLGQIAESQGHLAEAEMYCKQALAVRQASQQRNRLFPETEDIKLHLAYLLLRTGKIPQCSAHLRDIEQQTFLLPANSRIEQVVRLAADCDRMASKLGDNYQHTDEAAWLRNWAIHIVELAIKNQSVGATRTQIVVLLSWLGHLYTAQGDWKKAERILRYTVETSRRLNGPDDEVTIWTMHYLAELLHKEGRLKESETLVTAVIASFTKQDGPNSEHLPLGLYVSLLLETGRPAQALTVAKRLAAINRGAAASPYVHFSDDQYQSGNYKLALSLLNTAVQLDPNLGDASRRRQDILKHLYQRQSMPGN